MSRSYRWWAPEAAPCDFYLLTEHLPVAMLDAPGASRYESRAGGKLAAHSDYELADGVITFISTEVLLSFTSRGVGGRLASGVLEDVRRRGLAIVRQCPFIRTFIDRHPQYQDLVLSE